MKTEKVLTNLGDKCFILPFFLIFMAPLQNCDIQKCLYISFLGSASDVKGESSSYIIVVFSQNFTMPKVFLKSIKS